MKKSDEQIKDINKIFDEIFLTEENVTEQSYSEGFEDGIKFGNSEGYHVGYHRGAALGAEIGFYYGAIEVFLQSEHSEKLTKIITNLKTTIEGFPVTNSKIIDILRLANDIRALFRKICSILKVNIKYPELDDLSF